MVRQSVAPVPRGPGAHGHVGPLPTRIPPSASQLLHVAYLARCTLVPGLKAEFTAIAPASDRHSGTCRTGGVVKLRSPVQGLNQFCLSYLAFASTAGGNSRTGSLLHAAHSFGSRENPLAHARGSSGGRSGAPFPLPLPYPWSCPGWGSHSSLLDPRGANPGSHRALPDYPVLGITRSSPERGGSTGSAGYQPYHSLC